MDRPGVTPRPESLRYDRRVDRASRTLLPSRTKSSQLGQTRGRSIPFGAKTLTYRSVTNESQFWQLGIYCGRSQLGRITFSPPQTGGMRSFVS